MTVRPILQIGHPVLRQKAKLVPKSELGSEWLQQLIQDLIETMRASGGAGIAANQIGELWQVCVVEVTASNRYPKLPAIPLRVLVNPQITLLSEKRISFYEGCLSVPDRKGKVTRPAQIRLQAQLFDGTDIDEEIQGLPAVVYQHEVDHLDGILFVDKVDPKTLCTKAMYDAFVIGGQDPIP